VLDDAKRHAHTAQGLAVSTIWGELLWVGGGWPGSCHEHELLALAGLEQALDGVEVASLLDRGFRGLARLRDHWHAPVGDRRTIDRLTGGQRASNREQAGLRALVEQAVAQLAGAWALRRWRGCWTGFGMSAGPLARCSAFAAGSSGSAARPHRRDRTPGSLAAALPSPSRRVPLTQPVADGCIPSGRVASPARSLSCAWSEALGRPRR